MNYKIDIMTDTAFWANMARRYFEAECSEEEERLLKSFVASPFSDNDVFDGQTRSLFNEVRATMSLFAAAKRCQGKAVSQLYKSNKARIWGWTATGIAAAVAGVTFLLMPSSDGNSIHNDVCKAMINGVEVTDRDEVIELMRDSWEDIGLQPDEAGIIESQMKEIFDISSVNELMKIE